jgi:starch synthase
LINPASAIFAYPTKHSPSTAQNFTARFPSSRLGCGLDGLLRGRMEEGCLHGIVNGIDTSWISPMDTRKVQMADVRVWKEHNATAIRHAFDLAPTRGPLFSIISRLVHQKGIDLAIEAAETIVDAGGQIAVTGRGDPKLESAIVDLARRYPGSVGVHIGFDELEARKMFSAADFLVMPSRFEPCGLSQMYAQRCGTLPIACRTGGLADTIEDNCSGFLFQSPCASDLIAALKRALLAFGSKPCLEAMRKHALGKCFDWANPTQKYLGVHSQSLQRSAASLARPVAT